MVTRFISSFFLIFSLVYDGNRKWSEPEVVGTGNGRNRKWSEPEMVGTGNDRNRK